MYSRSRSTRTSWRTSLLSDSSLFDKKIPPDYSGGIFLCSESQYDLPIEILHIFSLLNSRTEIVIESWRTIDLQYDIFTLILSERSRDISYDDIYTTETESHVSRCTYSYLYEVWVYHICLIDALPSSGEISIIEELYMSSFWYYRIECISEN